MKVLLLGNGDRRDYAWSAVVSFMAFLMLASIWNSWQDFRASEIRVAFAQTHNQQMQAELAQAQAQVQQLNNPQFIERKAREDLQMIRPGETPFAVANPADAFLDPVPNQSPVAEQPPTGWWAVVSDWLNLSKWLR